MASITETSKQVLDRILSIEIVRVTERAAVSAARLRGHGNEKAADQAAVTPCGGSSANCRSAARW